MKSNSEDKHEQLERRIESLEGVMAELNVFLARLSAEVLSLKVAAGASRKAAPLAGNSNLLDHTKIFEGKSKAPSAAAPLYPDLQEETIESYSFHDEKGASPPSDHSSTRSFDSKDHQQAPRIPFYRGERDAEIIWEWLHKVESYFRIGQATPEERVLIATYHLKDAAYFWWKNSGFASSIRSWEDFHKAFLKAFMPVNYLREAKFALMDLRQLKSVKEYSSQFRKLVSRLPGLSEEDKLAYYVHGLKCSVRMDVDDHDPRTVDEAMVLADMSESKRWKSLETCS